jgi:hypothetical protein
MSKDDELRKIEEGRLMAVNEYEREMGRLLIQFDDVKNKITSQFINRMRMADDRKKEISDGE